MRHSDVGDHKRFLSVVVPVRGDAEDLRQLPTVSPQRGLEAALEWVIVVDGVPGPALREWIAVVSNVAAVLVHEVRHRDPGLARNEGLTLAQGRYVCFLDADDEASVASYVALATTLSLNTAPIGIVGFQVVDENRHGKVVETWYPAAGRHCGWADLRRRAAVWRFVFEREFLVSTGIQFPCGGYGEDLIFLAEVLSVVPEVFGVAALGYTYRIHSESQLTAQRSKAREASDILKVLGPLAEPPQTMTARAVLASWYARIALLHYRELRGRVTLDPRLVVTGLLWSAADRLCSRAVHLLEGVSSRTSISASDGSETR